MYQGGITCRGKSLHVIFFVTSGAPFSSKGCSSAFAEPLSPEQALEGGVLSDYLGKVGGPR